MDDEDLPLSKRGNKRKVKPGSLMIPEDGDYDGGSSPLASGALTTNKLAFTSRRPSTMAPGLTSRPSMDVEYDLGGREKRKRKVGHHTCCCSIS